MRSSSRRPLVISVVVLLAVVASAPAQETPGLTRLQPDGALAAERLQDGVLRGQRLDVDAGLLRSLTVPGDRLALQLFPDTSVVAVLREVSDDRYNGYVWSGSVEGEALGSVILVLDDGEVIGEVRTGGRRYALRAAGPGRGLALETDLRAENFADDAIVPPFRIPDTEARAAVEPAAAANSVIDFIGLYFPLVSTEAGGARVMKQDFKVAVASFNEALKNAKVNMTVRLMAVKKVPYSKKVTDSDSGTEALTDLTYTGDGQLEKAHTFRRKFGADFVTLAVNDNDIFCGRGWLNGNLAGVPASDADWAFNVVNWQCVALLTSLTTAHEVGHNMGLQHDRDNAPNPDFGGYPYSYGYRVPGHFRTIMAYSCQSFGGMPECPRVTHFSNPKAKYQGVSTGVKSNKPDGADAAKSLNNDRTVLENFTACTKRC